MQMGIERFEFREMCSSFADARSAHAPAQVSQAPASDIITIRCLSCFLFENIFIKRASRDNKHVLNMRNLRSSFKWQVVAGLVVNVFCAGVCVLCFWLVLEQL